MRNFNDKSKIAKEMFDNEIKVLEHFQGNTSIISVLDSGEEFKENEEKPTPFIVFELGTGDVFSFYKTSGAFSEPVARYFFNSMVSAVGHCHSNGFAHRDLKLENFIVNEKFEIKLIDFGGATYNLNEDGTPKFHTDIIGTADYLAPEIWNKLPYKGE